MAPADRTDHVDCRVRPEARAAEETVRDVRAEGPGGVERCTTDDPGGEVSNRHDEPDGKSREIVRRPVIGNERHHCEHQEERTDGLRTGRLDCGDVGERSGRSCYGDVDRFSPSDRDEAEPL
nr:hypothetical protein [Natrinema soli]